MRTLVLKTNSIKILLPAFLFLLSIGVNAQGKTDSTAENILIFQRSSGGWPKHLPMRGKNEMKVNIKLYKLQLAGEEKEKICSDYHKNDATYDNGATDREIRYLIKTYQTTGNQEYLDAAERGIAYILDGQYKTSGGWPQFYPLRGGYPDHITYNDDAMINCLNILRDVVDGTDGFDAVNPAYIDASKKAIQKGIECILNTQIVKEGELTVWCAQHDEFTLAPANARAYELASFSGQESVGIIRFLMGIENPSKQVINSITSAMKWMETNKIVGYTTEFQKAEGTTRGFDRVLVAKPDAYTWARFYDLETGKPFFCGRDGIKKASMAEIEYERRVGYAWYGDWPKKLLEEEYPEWRKRVLGDGKQ